MVYRLASAGFDAILEQTTKVHLSAEEIRRKHQEAEDRFQQQLREWEEWTKTDEYKERCIYVHESHRRYVTPATHSCIPPYDAGSSTDSALGLEPFYNLPNVANINSVEDLTSEVESASEEIKSGTKLIDVVRWYVGHLDGKFVTIRGVNEHFLYGGGLYRYQRAGSLWGAQAISFIWLEEKLIPSLTPLLASLVDTSNFGHKFAEHYKEQLSDVSGLRQMAKLYNDGVKKKLSWLYFGKYFADDINRLVPEDTDGLKVAMFFTSLVDQINIGMLFTPKASATAAVMRKEVSEFNAIGLVTTLSRDLMIKGVDISDDAEVDKHIRDTVNPVDGFSSSEKSTIISNMKEGVRHAREQVQDMLIDLSTVHPIEYTEDDVRSMQRAVDDHMDQILKDFHDDLEKEYAYTPQKRHDIGVFMYDSDNIRMFSQAYNDAGSQIGEVLDRLKQEITDIEHQYTGNGVTRNAGTDTAATANLMYNKTTDIEHQYTSNDVTQKGNDVIQNGKTDTAATRSMYIDYYVAVILKTLKATDDIDKFYREAQNTRLVKDDSLFSFMTKARVAGVANLYKSVSKWLRDASGKILHIGSSHIQNIGQSSTE